MFQKILLVISASLLLIATNSAQGTSTSTSSTTTDSKSTRGPVFRATKDQIKQVQTMLKDKKLYAGEATGSLSDETRTAISSFQKTNSLKETGTLNRVTLEKMGIELTDTQKAIPVSPSSGATPTKDSKPPKSTTASTSSGDVPKRPAPFRSNADQIKAAQKILKDGKMYAGDETGKLDDATRDGLKKYQETNGLKVTGSLNAATLVKMSITLTDAQKANVAAQAAYDAAKKK